MTERKWSASIAAFSAEAAYREETGRDSFPVGVIGHVIDAIDAAYRQGWRDKEKRDREEADALCEMHN